MSVKSIQVPKELKFGNAFKVSVGYNIICAIDTSSKMVCFSGSGKKVKMWFIPWQLRKGVKEIRMGKEKHCGISNSGQLVCWGI